MYICQLTVLHFRGFSKLNLQPMGHVVLIGEPRSGRSDVVEALSRVLDPDAIRTRTATELDFHLKDTTKPIEIEVILGGLGPDLEQHFLDNLEVWKKSTGVLVKESESPEDIEGDDHEWILRLAYSCHWLTDQERCEEHLYYPKHSDPSTKSFLHAKLTDIELLGFTQLHHGSGRILDLAARGSFRKIVNQSSGNDFATAIDQYVEKVADAAKQFTSSNQVKKALEDVIVSLHEILRVKSKDFPDLVEFTPEGGSPSGLLRSLGPAIDLNDGSGVLPMWRQGSTISALFRLAESLALSSGSQNIVAVDDLGDGMDPASAIHLGATIRSVAGQAWITTRLPSICEIFEPTEVIRLGRNPDGNRIACRGTTPSTKSEMITIKHWHRNLLPVLNYRSVIVVEGPHDHAVLHSLAIRLSNEVGKPLPATYNVAIINAGATGSGGYANVFKLTSAARKMGLHTVGVIDGDSSIEAKQFLKDHSNDADVIIRLPDDYAIELTIIDGVEDKSLRLALRDISAVIGLPVIPNLDNLPRKELELQAIKIIKRNTLHTAFIEALPYEDLPALAISLLDQTVLAAKEEATGIIQL